MTPSRSSPHLLHTRCTRLLLASWCCAGVTRSLHPLISPPPFTPLGLQGGFEESGVSPLAESPGELRARAQWWSRLPRWPGNLHLEERVLLLLPGFCPPVWPSLEPHLLSERLLPNPSATRYRQVLQTAARRVCVSIYTGDVCLASVGTSLPRDSAARGHLPTLVASGPACVAWHCRSSRLSCSFSFHLFLV